MPIPEARQVIEVPEGVQVTLQPTGLVTVKGKNGELQRSFAHPDIRVEQADGDLVVRADYPRRKTKALVGTWASHLRNMVKGSQENFEYRMKIVFSHFPIKAKAQGPTFLIENFLGEKTPRRANILGKVKVNVQGEEVVLSGANLEEVSQTAANIEQATRVRGFDIRVFQDGIYITEKGK